MPRHQVPCQPICTVQVPRTGWQHSSCRCIAGQGRQARRDKSRQSRFVDARIPTPTCGEPFSRCEAERRPPMNAGSADAGYMDLAGVPAPWSLVLNRLDRALPLLRAGDGGTNTGACPEMFHARRLSQWPSQHVVVFCKMGGGHRGGF